MFEFLIAVQRTIREALSADIAIFSETRSWLALISVLPLGIVFGVAHALTPGHSKSRSRTSHLQLYWRSQPVPW